VSVTGAGVYKRDAQDRSSCALCARADKARTIKRERDDAVVWGVALVSAVVAAVAGFGPDRWFGIGVFAGVLIGGACAWFTVRGALRHRNAGQEQAVHALAADADERVAGVIRQFEWSVNDIIRLKSDAERAALTSEMLLQLSREKDAYVHHLERELAEARVRTAFGVPPRETKPLRAREAAAGEGAVPFHWALHHDGYGVNLELQCGTEAVKPTRVRIVDADGTIVMTSGNAMYDDAGVPAFTMPRPPVALLVDLDTGAASMYRLEALVDITWLPVRMDDTGRRTKAAWDKNGRQYREQAPLPLETRRPAPPLRERSLNLH
jgi:hypothetical protein